MFISYAMNSYFVEVQASVTEKQLPQLGDTTFKPSETNLTYLQKVSTDSQFSETGRLVSPI